MEVLVCDLPGANENESQFLTVNIGGLWVSSPVQLADPTNGRLAKPSVGLHLQRGYGRRDSVLCGDFNVRADDTQKGKLQHELEELKSLGFVDLYRKARLNPSIGGQG